MWGEQAPPWLMWALYRRRGSIILLGLLVIFASEELRLRTNKGEFSSTSPQCTAISNARNEQVDGRNTTQDIPELLRARLGDNTCDFQVWLDVDNVLADARGRVAAHTSNNLLGLGYQQPDEVLKDPIIPHANRVVNKFFWLGCSVNILTAREQWPEAEATTNKWLQKHGFLYHNLVTTASAHSKVALLEAACNQASPCVFVDDLRSGWHIAPVGNNTQLYDKLVKTYQDNPYIVLELFHPSGGNSWTDIELKYFHEETLSSHVLLARPSVLQEGTLDVLRGHIDRSDVFDLSSNRFNLLWILKQNPKYEEKSLHHQLGVRQPSDLSTLPWAEMLQNIQLSRHQMVNSIPGVIELFGTKSKMYANARTGLTLNSFILPLEMEAFESFTKALDLSLIWVYKPDNESNGQGIHLGNFSTIQSVYSGGLGVVQQLISNPLLSKDQQKFDFRMYVLITSMDTTPPRAYINRNGYVRVAGVTYQRPDDISSQILNSNKSPSTRMSIREFWQDHFVGNDSDRLMDSIHSSIAAVLKELPAHLGCRSANFAYACSEIRFQLLGIDVGLDDSGKAHVFEIGFDPSLKRRSGRAAKEINDNDDLMYSDIFNIMHASMLAKVGSDHGSTETSRAEAESCVLGSFKKFSF